MPKLIKGTEALLFIDLFIHLYSIIRRVFKFDIKRTK